MASIEVGPDLLFYTRPLSMESSCPHPSWCREFFPSSKTFCTIRRQTSSLGRYWATLMVYAGRIEWKNYPKKSVRHMALRPRPMRQSLHLCKEQVSKARMDLGEARRMYLHVAVNLLRFTVSSKQPAQNSHPPHPGYLLGHSSIGSTLSLT